MDYGMPAYCLYYDVRIESPMRIRTISKLLKFELTNYISQTSGDFLLMN